ncbi:MAG: tetratricopeptide repeat protein [Betaproteobacteria bacterium]|nr:tetratricopeptide repeat protein [Betaproteobacteria bacterium]
MNYDYTRYYLRGWLLHFFGFRETALDAYTRAFKANPKSARAARHLAAIAAEKKELAASARWFETVVELEPGDGNSWFNLGFVRDAAGRKTEAIAAFKQAIALVPSLDRAWYGLGLAYAATGDHAQAAEALRKVVELQPMNGIGYYQLGMAYHHLNDPDNVEKTVVKLVKFDPKHANRLMRDARRTDLLHLLPEPLR